MERDGKAVSNEATADYESADHNHLMERILDLHELLQQTTEEALRKGRFSNLSRKEMRLLRAVGLYEERGMGELAQEMNVTLGTLSVAVKRLVSKGYIIRRKGEGDQRRVLLRLTHEGKVACRLYRRFNRILTQKVFDHLTCSEEKRLEDLIRRCETVIAGLYKDYRGRKIPGGNVNE